VKWGRVGGMREDELVYRRIDIVCRNANLANHVNLSLSSFKQMYETSVPAQVLWHTP
jgi:hypothetical protein